MGYTRDCNFVRPSIPTDPPGWTAKDTLMWLVGLELGIVAILLAIVGLALRRPHKNDSKDAPDD